MATDKKLSTLVESQLPSYLLDEGPNLVAFVKAYYEWLEERGQATDALKNLIVNQDIDTTDLGKFYDYFRREVLSEFPDNVLANKKLLAKKIKDLYQAKGSKQAHRLLFRLLYNEEIDFYNPSDNILRTSDGRWTKENSIRLGFPFVGNLDNLVGEIITGVTSGATAKVSSVITTFESGIEVKELFLSEISGEFLDLETVRNSNSTISGAIVNTVGPLRNVVFPDVRFSRSGSGHVIGDRVRFTSASGSGANGSVTQTSDLAVTLTLVNGGSGYRVNNSVILVTGGTGSGLSGTVTSINSPENILFFDDTIDSLKDTPIGFGPTFSSNSGFVSANLASANAFTALGTALGTSNVQVGTVNSISVVIGTYIDLPTITVIDAGIAALEESDGSGGIKGQNAVVIPERITGAITTVLIDNFGTRYNAADQVTVTNLTRSGTTQAVGDPIVSGVVENRGKYSDTKGFISWDQKLQDSYYYQIFSYVIRSTNQGIKKYRDLVNKLVHPAGTKFFGQVDIEDTISFVDADIETFFQIDLIGSSNGISIPSTLTFGTTQLDMEISANTVPSSLVFGTTALGYVYLLGNVSSIISTEIVPNVNVLFVVGVDTSIESTALFGTGQFNFSFEIPSITDTVISANTLLLLQGAGTVSVSNNNAIDSYLGQPIQNYLDSPVITVGTPFAVIGNNTFFLSTVSNGSIIEIEDVIPGLSGNTTYIVNTVFSNTTLTINTPFAGGNLVSGIYRYNYI